MMNPLCQRISWVIAPSNVRRQPLLEGKQCLWTCSIDLLFKRGANVLQRQEVLHCQKLEDSGEEQLTHL
jgi:hypothetical protein